MRRTVDAVAQVAQLLGVVQHLDALCVGVVAHREGSGDGGCKFPAAETIILIFFFFFLIFYFNIGLLAAWPFLGGLPTALTSLSLWHLQSSQPQSRWAGTL